MAFVALLDANVLYPAYLRDLLLRLAQAGVYQPRWSAEILDEVARNIKKGRDDAGQEKVDCMISLMKRHFEDAEVTGYEGLVPAMTNDPKDRHVLAAAITGGADVIVTYKPQTLPAAIPRTIQHRRPGTRASSSATSGNRRTMNASSRSWSAGQLNSRDTRIPWREFWKRD